MIHSALYNVQAPPNKIELSKKIMIHFVLYSVLSTVLVLVLYTVQYM